MSLPSIEDIIENFGLIDDFDFEVAQFALGAAKKWSQALIM